MREVHSELQDSVTVTLKVALVFLTLVRGRYYGGVQYHKSKRNHVEN